MAGKIEKNQRDSREYEFILLPNSIKCLLVSDPDCEISAASMNVHVGSIHEDIPGLAHYLEHMLFMGTTKYPEENEYSNYLSDNAGSSNAFTDNEDTNYFFKVSSDHLFKALDMFSQFFVSPTFNQNSLERELKAIDSEFHKNILDDHWRIQQIINNNSSKPINHFGLGNSSTLSVDGIRDRIIEFYHKFYSANLMSLVIYGKEDVETLKKWAVDLFSLIKNNDVSLPVYPNPTFDTIQTITKIIPVKDNKSLRFLWALPSLIEFFEYKPEGYIAHLLGHEGENSLLSYLKFENLAEELSSYHEDPFTFCSYLCVDVKLTDKGLEQYEYVAEIVYAFIQFLTSHVPEEYIFSELKQIAEAEFLFKNKKDPYWFCQKLGSRLAKYPPSKVLTAPELYFSFNASLISETLKHLNYSNLQLFLISKSHNKQEMLTEKWFGTLYKVEKFEENFVLRLKSPQINTNVKKLGLPKRNPYVPNNHDLLPLGTEKYPRMILQNNETVVWFKQDSKFAIDKVYGQLIIHCNSCDFDSSPYVFMLGKLWNKILDEKIREESYLADLAGLKHEVDVDNYGIRVTLNGFSNKYSVFFEYLLQKISEFVPTLNDQRLFDDIKNEYITTLTNCYFSKPTTQLQRIVYEINLVGGYFTQLSKLKSLINISLNDVIFFSSKWLKNVYFEWFVMGNTSETSVLALVKSSLQKFKFHKSLGFMTPDQYLILKTTKLKKNSSELFQSTLTDPNDTNSAVIAQWQLGPESLKTECLLELIENYLEEPCFDTLRTKEQLGYIVNSYSHKIRGVLNFMILVQSSTHCPGFIFDRISSFIDLEKQSLQGLTDKKFNKLVKSTIESVLKKDLSLQEEYQRFKYELESAAYIFSRKKLKKDCIRQITKQEFLKAFEIFEENGRKLEISIVSQLMENEEKNYKRNRKVFEGLTEFKRKHGVWPQVNKRQ